MTEKYVCVGLNCAVFVFGRSTRGICPGCGEEASALTNHENEEFMDWYRSTSSR